MQEILYRESLGRIKTKLGKGVYVGEVERESLSLNREGEESYDVCQPLSA